MLFTIAFTEIFDFHKKVMAATSGVTTFIFYILLRLI